MGVEFSHFPLILLAGGKSSRAGAPKGLIEFDGRPWVEWQCEQFLGAGGREIVLVLGFHPAAYEKLTLPREVARVNNPDPDHGPFTSVQAGARKVLERGSPGAFVLPIDVPVPILEVWEKLASELTEGVRICQPTFLKNGQERGGHPVLVSEAELRELVQMFPTFRLDRRIHELPEGALKRVAVHDSSILANLNDPEDWVELRKSRATSEIGKGAAILSAAEVGLGSLLHSMHVPTSGHWLSLNQSFWLSRTHFALRGERDSKWAPLTVSNVTACLKSLSPAGKKLTPMLAISAQGTLFNLGTVVLGGTTAGAIIGAVLLSFWAFIQPLAIYYLIFGNTLIDALKAAFSKLQEVVPFSSEQALWIAVSIVGLKALLAAATVVLAAKLPRQSVESYRQRLLKAANLSRTLRPETPPGGTSRGIAKAAARDLVNPLFLISLALTAAFFIWAESSRSQLIWGLLRPLAVGFAFFFGARMLPLTNAAAKLESRGFTKFAEALRVAQSVTRERQ